MAAADGGGVGDDVLSEALELVTGDRARAYGDPLAGAERFAEIASAATGLDVRPEHLPILLIALKLSRHANVRKRDNLVDIAGYCWVAEQIQRGEGGR